MGYRNYTKQDYNKAVELKHNGLNLCQISRKLNIPRSTIKSWLSKGYNSNTTFRKGYTDDDIIIAAKEVFSMAELLRRFGLTPAGGNYEHMQKQLYRLNLLCEHWTKQSWCKDKQLKDWKDYSKNSNLKPNLIKFRGHKCEDCGLSEWKGGNIPLELHHIDGNRSNNEVNNLQLLCCNCHALTPNYRRNKDVLSKRENGIKTVKEHLCPDCNTEIWSRSKYCHKCSIKYRNGKVGVVGPAPTLDGF